MSAPSVVLGLFERNGNIFCNSRDVARHFGKTNAHVNRDIRNLIEGGAPQSNFGPNKINDLTGSSVADYDLTRDGFMLLVMGFTGPEALRMKLVYIDQFNKMEEALRQVSVSIPKTYAEALIEAGRLAQERDKALSEVERQKSLIDEVVPKAAAHDYLASLPGELGVQNAGRELKVGQKWVTDYIDGHGWSCIQGKKRVPAHYGLKMGYVRLVPETYPHPHTGEEMVKHEFRITQKGLRRLAEIIAALKEKNERPFAKKPEGVS